MFKRDIFDLAIIQIGREGKLYREDWMILVIDRAREIRKWMDRSEANKRGAKTRAKKKKIVRN